MNLMGFLQIFIFYVIALLLDLFYSYKILC